MTFPPQELIGLLAISFGRDQAMSAADKAGERSVFLRELAQASLVSQTFQLSTAVDVGGKVSSGADSSFVSLPHTFFSSTKDVRSCVHFC
jgi:hypothetical protein